MQYVINTRHRSSMYHIMSQNKQQNLQRILGFDVPHAFYLNYSCPGAKYTHRYAENNDLYC